MVGESCIMFVKGLRVIASCSDICVEAGFLYCVDVGLEVGRSRGLVWDREFDEAKCHTFSLVAFLDVLDDPGGRGDSVDLFKFVSFTTSFHPHIFC